MRAKKLIETSHGNRHKYSNRVSATRAAAGRTPIPTHPQAKSEFKTLVCVHAQLETDEETMSRQASREFCFFF